MKSQPSRGLPPHVVIPVVLCIAIFAAIPITLFLKTGFGTNGSSIAPSEIQTPPPAIALALGELRSRIAHNPRDVEALSSLAGLYAQIGKLDEAASLEGQAVKAAPQNLALREADATLLRNAGKPKQAIAQLNAILSLQPNNTDALFERAALDADLRNHAGFINDMRTFLRVAPANDARRAIAQASIKGQRP